MSPKRTDPARSAIMRAVKSAGTAPERKVAAMLRGIAPGYRLHRKDIPGRPDFCWIGRKRAVFVHGCFWHGHECARGARTPKENAAYWSAKIARNRARDAENLRRLAALGWRVATIWECELKGGADAVRERLAALLALPGPSSRSKSRDL
jgi:DNA mismatch endonuclease (patch repair protein)